MRSHPLVIAEQDRHTSTSWAPKTEQQLTWHPRVHMHFTPTHASWLNQVEVCLVPSLGPPSQVRDQTDAFVAAYNATAHPFEWTTQVVCVKHFQVSTYRNECNQVLVYCLTNGFTTPGLRQNVFNCFGPHQRLVVFVTESNELADRFDQLRHALKDATRDSLARDLSTRFSHEALAGIMCR